MSDLDKALLLIFGIPATLLALAAISLGVIMFIHRRELDFRYVLFGIRAPRSTGETESQG